MLLYIFTRSTPLHANSKHNNKNRPCRHDRTYSQHKHKIKHDKTTMQLCLLCFHIKHLLWIFTYTYRRHIAFNEQISWNICSMRLCIFSYLIYYSLLNASFTKFHLPVPCRTYSIFNWGFSLPTQLLVSQCRVSPYFYNITGTTAYNLIV